MLPPIKIDKSLAEAMRKMQKAQEKKEEAQEEIKPLLPIDPKLPSCYIFDIDRTLARRSPERGIFEFEKAGDDQPIIAVKNLIQNLWFTAQDEVDTRVEIIFWTGRERKFESVTRAWLMKHGIGFDQLLMRTTGSFEKAEVLKENLFVNFIAHKYNVLFVLDDDILIGKLCRRLGLYYLQSDSTRG